MEIGNMSSYYTDYAKSSTSSSELAKLQNKLNSSAEDSSDEELMEVCKEFESYFLEKMYKEMLKTIPKDENEDTYASDMVDYFQDSAIQDLTKQATEQGGFGLAQTLYEQMKRQYSGVDPASLTAE